MRKEADLLETVRALRLLASDFDAHAFALEGDFTTHGADVEEAARVARPLVRNAATALFDLLYTIEKKT
jgi:hypothetical protein